MTWILALATIGVLGSIALACHRAAQEAAEQLCDCLPSSSGARPGGYPLGAAGAAPRAARMCSTRSAARLEALSPLVDGMT